MLQLAKARSNGDDFEQLRNGETPYHAHVAKADENDLFARKHDEGTECDGKKRTRDDKGRQGRATRLLLRMLGGIARRNENDAEMTDGWTTILLYVCRSQVM